MCVSHTEKTENPLFLSRTQSIRMCAELLFVRSLSAIVDVIQFCQSISVASRVYTVDSTIYIYIYIPNFWMCRSLVVYILLIKVCVFISAVLLFSLFLIIQSTSISLQYYYYYFFFFFFLFFSWCLRFFFVGSAACWCCCLLLLCDWILLIVWAGCSTPHSNSISLSVYICLCSFFSILIIVVISSHIRAYTSRESTNMYSLFIHFFFANENMVSREWL